MTEDKDKTYNSKEELGRIIEEQYCADTTDYYGIPLYFDQDAQPGCEYDFYVASEPAIVYGDSTDRERVILEAISSYISYGKSYVVFGKHLSQAVTKQVGKLIGTEHSFYYYGFPLIQTDMSFDDSFTKYDGRPFAIFVEYYEDENFFDAFEFLKKIVVACATMSNQAENKIGVFIMDEMPVTANNQKEEISLCLRKLFSVGKHFNLQFSLSVENRQSAENNYGKDLWKEIVKLAVVQYDFPEDVDDEDDSVVGKRCLVKYYNNFYYVYFPNSNEYEKIKEIKRKMPLYMTSGERKAHEANVEAINASDNENYFSTQNVCAGISEVERVKYAVQEMRKKKEK